MKIIKALLALTCIAGWSSIVAAPQAVTLISHHARSSSGTLTTLVWKGGCFPSTGSGCYNFTHAWTAANIDPGGSTAAWTWDDATGVLSSSGLFITTSFINSSPSGSSVLGDRVVDLVIDTTNDVIPSTSSYRCIEGTFLQSVGANGCGTYNLGQNFVADSSMAYDVGGDAFCEQRTMGGDDISTGNPRGVRTAAAYVSGSNNCDATNGAFSLFTVAQNSGGILIVSNGICLGTAQVEAACANVNYMTFAVPIPAGAWLLGSALGLLGWLRRKRAS
jgi:hypothetical protein